MAEATPRGEIDAETRRLLDRLGATPEQLFTFGNRASDAVSTIAHLTPHRDRPRPGRSFLSGLWRINLDTFHAALSADMDSRGIGYCYIMRRKGVVVHARSANWARLPGEESGQIRWSFNVPMATGSVTKFITAMAVEKMLKLNSKQPDDMIGRYLPEYWRAPTESRTLTFHDLLRHEAGLGTEYPDTYDPDAPNDFISARDEIREGPGANRARAYKNINYTILRVMFATLGAGVDPAMRSPMPWMSDDDLWDFVSATAYANFLNDNIFAAADLDGRGFEPPENAARAYETFPTVPGGVSGDYTRGAGAGGLYLSVQELVKLLGEFRRGGSIVPPWRAEQMMDDLYGLDPPLATQAGTVHRKGGRTPLGPLKGLDTAIYLMPGQIEFAIFTNAFPKPPSRLPDRPPVELPSHLERIPTMILNSVEFIF